MVSYHITNLHLSSVEQAKHPTKLESVKKNGKYHTKTKGAKRRRLSEPRCDMRRVKLPTVNFQPLMEKA